MEDGLSNNEVQDITQDSNGYIWFATADGLDRYDGYTLKVFRHSPDDPGSLSGNFVRSLAIDSSGRLWIATLTNGLNLYDPATGTFRHFHHSADDPNSLITDSLWTLKAGPESTLLVGTSDAGLDVLNTKTLKFQHFPAGSGPNTPSDNKIQAILLDHQNNIWVGTAIGLDSLNLKGGIAHHFAVPGNKLASNIVAMDQDDRGRIWIATHGGPYIYLPYATALKAATSMYSVQSPLWKSVLNCVFLDSRQNIWFGSWKNGLFLDRDQQHKILNYLHGVNGDDSIIANVINTIFEDRSGYIWVATNAGVSVLDPNMLDIYSLKPSTIKGGQAKTDAVTSLVEHHGDLLMGGVGGVYKFPLSATEDTLQDKRNIFVNLDVNRDGAARAIAQSSKGDLLISTDGGSLLLVGSSGKILRRWHPGTDLNRHLQPINRIVLRNDNDAYLGTFGTGLLHFDLPTGRTSAVGASSPSGLMNSDIVEDLVQTAPGQLIAGTFRGIFRVDMDTGHSSLLPLTPGNAEPVVQSLFEDKQHVLWIGTYDGLWQIQLDSEGKPLSHAKVVSQFSHTQVLAIEHDDIGRLWLATANSLIRFDPKNGDVLVFGKNQGSPMSEYYSYGHIHSSDGRLWFAGGQGIIGFEPSKLQPNRHPPSVTLNSAVIYRKDQPLSLPLAAGQSLTLSYQDRISIFDVAATDFGAPAANTYSYRLLGFQSDWTPPNTLHQITFTNLSPGRYRLEVRAANNWGTWSSTPATLELIVLPPWWRTWWAYTIYLLIIIGSAIAYVYSLKRKIIREKAVSASLREANEIKSNFVEKLEFQVKEATQELRETLQGVNLKNAELEIAQRRAAEGEQVKSQFLANMSHELRTPLTGVLGYTKLLNSTNLNSEQKDYVGTIRVSSEALLAIINDTLDLSRLEAGKLLIDEVDFDLLELIESTLELLAPIAYQKRLELIRVIPPEVPLQLRGDPLRMRQVLTNLLSNAIKFTESGSVCLEVKALEQTDRDATIGFRIIDTGIGIPEGEIGQLFNAYNRGRISTRHQVEGTGLGLAICKKLLDLMGGSVGVESRVGTGSTFHFQVKFRLQKHATPRQQLPKKLSILLYDKHALSNAAWKASLTRLGGDVRDVAELESLMALQAEAAVLSLSERELAHLGELRQKFSPALPPMLILAPRIDRQTLKDLSEALYHRVLSKTAREKTVYLELQSLVQHAIHVPAPVAESKPAPSAAAPAPDAPLVLVADDNRINRRLLVTMLNQSGFRTAEAGNGIELLDLAARGPFQAAILDIHMPGMDGIETATRLRITYGEQTPPIIAMSADVLPGGPGGPQQGLMDDFLMKPFNEHQLVDLLRNHLERYKHRRRAAG